jgi:D-alanyl-D-alanine carboxypeptidase
VDGIKTGYTRASGFNLVSSVRRDGRHIIAVVMGGKTAASRDAKMRDLIATHLPTAKVGNGNGAAVLVAQAPAPAPAPTEIAAIYQPDVRLPSPRPGKAEEAEEIVAYAPTAAPRDLVAAAMAEPALAPKRAPAPAPAAQQASSPAPATPPTPVMDPIFDRIAGATQVAEIAAAQMKANDDTLLRLTLIARNRTGAKDMVASAPRIRTSNPDAGEAGWHIQIGAVPTMEGAQELIEQAQSSMGPVLASRQPLTQEVARDGITLYRARFAGFDDKDEARDTCDKLKTKSFSCLAVRN